jgi:type II secretory ATPase GspE/PulE/Tfp pilus assembly ATPase PilB-like protein
MRLFNRAKDKSPDDAAGRSPEPEELEPAPELDGAEADDAGLPALDAAAGGPDSVVAADEDAESSGDAVLEIPARPADTTVAGAAGASPFGRRFPAPPGSLAGASVPSQTAAATGAPGAATRPGDAAPTSQGAGAEDSLEEVLPPPEAAEAVNVLGPRKRVEKYDYLLAQRLVTREIIASAQAEAKIRNISSETVLMEKYKIRKADISASLTLYYRHPFVALEKNFIPPAEVIDKLSIPRLKIGCWLPIRVRDNVVTVLVDDPTDLRKADAIEATLSAYRVRFVVGIRDNILQALEALTGEARTDVATILGDVRDDPANVETAQREDDLHRAETTKQESVTVRLASQIISDAHHARASDIHIEPSGGRRALSIRFRVDGTCITYQEIPPSVRHALVARFKIMAGLDIAERRKPQDGKIRIRVGQEEIELRVATIPTVGGNEDVVLRIFATQGAIALNDLGLTPRNLEQLIGAAAKPYGLILCVGPTGSGKTTTLHATLGHINTTERKIWTAEDPVEITQPGLRQVQVRPQIGYSFATAMRAFLRADPDVIMVGEMRDSETAAIAVEASLTGHLVLSTLHTNSAAETIVRMLELGLDAFNFSDALVAIVAQRLVKRVCGTCKQPHRATASEIHELSEPFGGREGLAALGHPISDDLELYTGKGCESCNGTGYRGRAAIHELLVGTDEIKHLILERARVPDLLAQARRDGMTTLVQDGALKVLQGVTTFPQVRAVAIR